MPERYCHCGKPLHYPSPEVQAAVERLIAAAGEDIPITACGRTWLVQRHYLALHGLKAWELPRLGFPEITGAMNADPS